VEWIVNLIVTKFRGVDYYIVEIDEDHQSGDTWYERSFPDVDSWCEHTFGEQDLWGETPVTGWKRMRNQYFFTEEGKRDWFVMRWA
jgi:hypothetical protein